MASHRELDHQQDAGPPLFPMEHPADFSRAAFEFWRKTARLDQNAGSGSAALADPFPPKPKGMHCIAGGPTITLFADAATSPLGWR